MRLLIFYLQLILIHFVCSKSTQQNKLEEFKKKNNNVIEQNHINNPQQYNNTSFGNQTKKENTYKESQLKILNDFKPLFGLRKQDQNRDENGQVIKQNISKDLELQNKIKKGTGIGSDNEQLIEIWDEQLGNFEPEVTLHVHILTITFDLPSGLIEVFYEDILKPTNIKGAFFISQIQQEERIDFYIKYSNNTVIYSKEKVIEAIFNIDILDQGEIKFIFQNKRTKGTQTITFTLDVHDSEQEFLQMADLDPLAQKIERISMAMNVLQLLELLQIKFI